MLYDFTEVLLDKEEFDNLVFMNPPPWWEEHSFPNNPLTEEQSFLVCLCRRPLKEVVQKVKKRAGYEERGGNSPAIFKELLNITARAKDGSDEQRPWFMDHKELNQGFKKDFMPPIWIRNLSSDERKSCPDGTYYIEDGNTRSLIYMLKVILEEEKYTPFPAIHATSWGIAAEILGHLPQKASQLENNGVFPYKRRFKEGVRLPIGIRVDTYERR